MQDMPFLCDHHFTLRSVDRYFGKVRKLLSTPLLPPLKCDIFTLLPHTFGMECGTVSVRTGDVQWYVSF